MISTEDNISPEFSLSSSPTFELQNRSSLTKSPRLSSPDAGDQDTENKTSGVSSISPLSCPTFSAIPFTIFDPQDDWLPITASRNGNKYYAAFHTLCSGLGIQALVVPVAFKTLGWTWGIISLSLAYIWQLYTLWLLVQLHESTETGMRFNRYLQLFNAAIDNKLGKSFACLAIIFLSGGTCVALIIMGGSNLKYFFHVACNVKILTAVEWYLVFTCMAVILSQLPNLNSIAGVSLIGAITGVGYCTLLWVVSVAKGRVPISHASYEPVTAETTDIGEMFTVFDALGIIVLAFRGHNLTLEIQATMPSTEKHPSRVPMWQGVKVAYTLIAMCLFPLAVSGYWAYGHQIPNDGMFAALHLYHSHDVSRFVLGLTSIFIVINALTSYQIYAMPSFDDLESKYTGKQNKPCPWWLRMFIRVLFAYLNFFGAVAFPFNQGINSLLGGLTLPVTMAYPCFIWLIIKKPKINSCMWCLNWGLGILGIGLSSLLTAAGVYIIVNSGIHGDFFNPK